MFPIWRKAIFDAAFKFMRNAVKSIVPAIRPKKIKVCLLFWPENWEGR